MAHNGKSQLTHLVQTSLPTDQVKKVLDEYHSFHAGTVEKRKANYATMVNDYYDLVTDFFEFGWGQSFHFAPRYKGESFEASLARYEFYIGHVLRLKPGMKTLDVGCGVGGPMRAIARFTGATIVGVNNNAYQITRGQKYNRAAGLSDQCSFVKADFMNLPLPERSFDAVYAIEATCHAPDKTAVFAELFRVMKEGAEFAGYEWCLTAKYEKDNAAHQRIKREIEEGTGLPEICKEQEVVDALTRAGFEVIEARDVAHTSDPETPWWLSLSASPSLAGIKRTPAGRWLTNKLVRILEAARIAPKGSTAVATFLNRGAMALVRGGKSDIFTPMFFFHARKPANPKTG